MKQILEVDIEGTETLVHGDYSPHNTIFSDNSVIIIDWEWAGWGNPLQDIAWVIWVVHLHCPRFCKELSEMFINTYCSYRDIDITSEKIKIFAILKLLNISNSIKTTKDINKEWLRILKWTLATDFLAKK